MNLPIPRPTLWKRYIDDTFCIWEHGKEDLDKFLNTLNAYDHNIKFTMELEEAGRLAFLDVMCLKKATKIETTIYRKPTTTFQLLHSSSSHNIAQKEGVIQCLVHRALNICSANRLDEELKLLNEIFLANGYKKETIERRMNQVLLRRNRSTGKSKAINSTL